MSTIVTCRLDAEVLNGLDRYAAHAGKGRSAAVEQILRRHLGIAGLPPGDGQTRESGAAANEWGRVTAQVVASALRAVKVRGEPANIFRLPDGRRALVKNAKGRGDRINVLPSLLERFDVLYAGFWDEGSTRCDLFAIPIDLFKECAPDVTRGKFMQVDRRTIERFGLSPVHVRAADRG